jgi:hypothetical protein
LLIGLFITAVEQIDALPAFFIHDLLSTMPSDSFKVHLLSEKYSEGLLVFTA